MREGRVDGVAGGCEGVLEVTWAGRLRSAGLYRAVACNEGVCCSQERKSKSDSVTVLGEVG